VSVMLKVRRYGGIIIVFASALFVTRNIGLAAVIAFLALTAFQRNFFANQPRSGAGGPVPPSPVSGLNEAYAILGLPVTASEDEVLAAYRALMKRNHPDQGGSTDIASKLNQAKTIILKHLRAKL
jgi:hypothetical protein